MVSLLGLVLLAGCGLASALGNGQAEKPPMGYNTWNCFGPNIDEELIRSTADLMVDLGLADAGYRYLNLDDGWSELQRSQEGRLLPNRARFPSGMAALSDYVHSKGLKFGIYSDAGSRTCAGFPGSRGYEAVDAQTWAEWGVDYLKYDNCWAPPSDWVVARYQDMGAALNKTGRPILYSLCEWGVAEPWLWAPEVANSWRTTADIAPAWESIMDNLDLSVGLARFAGPGAWNDPDMLEVGNGRLTLSEQRSHFALWALLKAPLLVGADLRALPPDSLAVLKARELIAVHQDDLGVPGDLVWKQGTKEIYAAPLADGGRAVLLLNRQASGGQYQYANITLHFSQLGYPRRACAKLRDMYAEADLGEACGSYTAAVSIHDVAALRLSPPSEAPPLARSGRRALRPGGQAEPPADYSDWRPWDDQPIYAFWDEDLPQPAAAFSVAADGAGPTARPVYSRFDRPYKPVDSA